jgi:hypothetical protein
VLPAAVVLLGVTLPVGLWLRHGRRAALAVTLQSSAYVVGGGQPLVLRARVRPVDARLRWSGPGLDDADQRRIEITAPSKPGIYTVAVEARHRGSRSRDRLSIEVLARPPEQLPLDRPAPRARPRPHLPRCGELPRIQVHGKACRDANLVLELEEAAPGDLIWHWWSDQPGQAVSGRLANLRVPSAAPAGTRLEMVT